MEDVKVIPVKTRDELRTWLQNNCHTERSCWVLVSMAPSPDRVLYLDAVEEALCFGWIDGIKRKLLIQSWLKDYLQEVRKAHGLN